MGFMRSIWCSMTPRKVIVLLGLALAALGCASPDPSPGYGPFLEGYAVREEVEPASFPDTFVPDTLLPGEERFEVLEVPEPPADTEPPPDLDEEPAAPGAFPYGGWSDGCRADIRAGPRPRAR
jgi:hypothetical protein